MYDLHIFLQAVHRIIFTPQNQLISFETPSSWVYHLNKRYGRTQRRILLMTALPFMYIPPRLFEILHCRSFTSFRTTTGRILIKGLACMAFVQSKSRWPSAPCFFLTLSSRTCRGIHSIETLQSPQFDGYRWSIMSNKSH